MVRAGLVDVLIEKLSDVAVTMGSLHEETPPVEPDPIPVPAYSPTSPVYTPSSPTYSYSSFVSLRNLNLVLLCTLKAGK